MAFVAAVAIGLNPYVGTFVLAGLAALTGHVPAPAAQSLVFALSPAVAVLAGLATPVDLVFSKFLRYAPRARGLSQFVAPFAAGGAALLTAEGDLPLVLVAAVAAAVSWAVATMVTSAARRASRSPAWVGLGHVPVLMSTAVISACLIPLGLARVPLGLVPAALAVAVLLSVTVLDVRHPHRASRTPPRPKRQSPYRAPHPSSIYVPHVPQP